MTEMDKHINIESGQCRTHILNSEVTENTGINHRSTVTKFNQKSHIMRSIASKHCQQFLRTINYTFIL